MVTNTEYKTNDTFNIEEPIMGTKQDGRKNNRGLKGIAGAKKKADKRVQVQVSLLASNLSLLGGKETVKTELTEHLDSKIKKAKKRK